MKLIACVDNAWGIGKNNELIYHLKRDMNFFRYTTRNKIVVMGKNTCLSLPNGKLKNRKNIVLSTTMDQPNDPDVTVCRSINDVFHEIHGLSNQTFIIGGGKIYELFLPYCTDALITRVLETADVDTVFPNLDEESDWKKTLQSPVLTEDEIKYEFLEYHNFNCKHPKGVLKPLIDTIL